MISLSTAGTQNLYADRLDKCGTATKIVFIIINKCTIIRHNSLYHKSIYLYNIYS